MHPESPKQRRARRGQLGGRGGTPVVVGAIVVAASSCQLVAGVRNDGELEETTTAAASSSSVGGATSSTSEASSSSSGMSSTSTGDPCSACEGVCVDGVCSVVTCVGDPAFDVFTPTELQNHKLANTIPSAIGNDHLVVGVVDTVTNEILVRGVDLRGMLTASVSHPLGTDARFAQARYGESNVSFQGRMNGEVGEIRVAFTLGDTDPHHPTFVSFGKPAACAASENVERVVFTVGPFGEISYAANCNQPGVSYSLIMGGETTPAQVISPGEAPTVRNTVEAYAYSSSNEHHLILTGDGHAGEQSYVRSGKTPSELATTVKFRLSEDTTVTPAPLMFLTDPGTGSFLFLGYDLRLSGNVSATPWLGLFDDAQSLAAALPLPGFASWPALDASELQTKLGFAGPPFVQAGMYATVIAKDELHLGLAVVRDDAQLLTTFADLYFSNEGKLRASSVGDIGGQTIAAWIEENNDISRVKARVVTCSVVPASP